jgi:zinc transport system substrate-binding protein
VIPRVIHGAVARQGHDHVPWITGVWPWITSGFGVGLTAPGSLLIMVFMSIWRTATAVLAAGVLAAGCSRGPGRSAEGAADAGSKLHVVAAFYPLEFVTQRVGGARVTVRSVTKPGAEPHDVELTPRDVAAIQDADLVVYLSKFQAQVDAAADRLDAPRRADVAEAAKLGLQAGKSRDPHFWLDPLRLADVGDQVAERLTARDPDGTAAYAAGVTSLRRDLEAMDAAYQAGLHHCAGTNLVTTHTAFGYLAARYGLTQIGIAGVDPEAEPTSADQAAAVDFARKNNVHTVFTEPLVSDSIAKAVAREIGGATAVLDPIEGIGKESQGKDYLEVMHSNLDALRAGLGCR